MIVTTESEEKTLKIAVTYEDGQVFQHFGHTEQFKIYDIKEGKVVTAAIVGTNGSGHGALADVLQKLDVDALICGGIGGGAINAVSEANIKLFAGVSGDADKAVEDFLAGKLALSTEANCDHHDHHEGGHSCGEHHHEGGGCGCGEHHEEHHHEGGSCGCGGHD